MLKFKYLQAKLEKISRKVLHLEEKKLWEIIDFPQFLLYNKEKTEEE